MILRAVGKGIVIRAALPPEGGVTVTRMLIVPQFPFLLSVAVKVDIYVMPLMRFYVSVVIVLKLSVIEQVLGQKHACVD